MRFNSCFSMFFSITNHAFFGGSSIRSIEGLPVGLCPFWLDMHRRDVLRYDGLSSPTPIYSNGWPENSFSTVYDPFRRAPCNPPGGQSNRLQHIGWTVERPHVLTRPFDAIWCCSVGRAAPAPVHRMFYCRSWRLGIDPGTQCTSSRSWCCLKCNDW